MISERIRKRLVATSLLSLLLSISVFAGVNENFAVTVNPAKFEAREIGQTFNVNVRVNNIVEISNALVIVNYNPTYLTPTRFTAGNLMPRALLIGNGLLPSDPSKATVGEDGTANVQGGAAIGGASNMPETGEGVLGSFTFEVVSTPPEAGTFISVTSVEASASVADPDLKEFAQGTLGVNVAPHFPNRIFDLNVERRHNAAVLTWNTRFPGINDQLTIRVAGSQQSIQVNNPLQDQITENQKNALRLLLSSNIDLRNPEPGAILTFLRDQGISVTLEEVRILRQLVDILQKNFHLVELPNLELGTEYEFSVRSTDLSGQQSPLFSDRFQTRSAPDVRPISIIRLNVKPLLNSVALTWGTNRLADTRLLIQDGDGNTVIDTLQDEDGVEFHLVEVRDLLQPGIEYTFTVTSRGVGLDDLIAEGSISEDDATDSRTNPFRTKSRQLPLRFVGPPHTVIGSDEVRLQIALNQPATLTIDYGEIISSTTKLAQESETVELYTESTTVTDALDRHEVTLSSLESSTSYRYRITAVSSEAEEDSQVLNTTTQITTDPSGNRQWSRDFRFKTSTSGDTLDPVIIKGPQVFKRARLAVFRWATDVETLGKVFVGTTGDNATLGTSDEIEIVDITRSGSQRISRRHFVVVTGLNRGTTYGYRIESTATNGKSVVFDPLSSATAAKRAKVLQPPGGAGSFVTDIEDDTQFPVLLSGPTISSKTHDTAVIEWTTDEPADSEIHFGTDELDEEDSSGDSELDHKLVITNLDVGTTYNYTIGSTDASGNGVTESSQATFTTNPDIDLTPPVITVAPDIVYKNDETATIQWTTDEVATAEVEFGTDEELGFIRSLSTTDKVHEVTLTNLTIGTEYSYKIASSDLNNNGPTESAILTFTTDEESDLTPPVLSDIVATPADSSVIITWSTDELADSFIEFGTDENAFDSNVGDTEDGLEHEIVLTNLDPGITYFYNVGSVDRANNPATESEVLNFTTLTSADLTPPASPTDLSGTAGSQQGLISWQANTEADLAGYNIYRRQEDGEFALIASRLTETSYTDLGLANDVPYEYQITAIDRASTPNESDPSTALALTPISDAAPSTPVGLSRDGEDFLNPIFSFTNSTPVNTEAALTYTIQVSTQSDFSDVTTSISGLTEGSGDAGTGKTAWTIDRTLDEGSTYYWRVRAVEDALIGSFSTTQQFVAEDAPELPGDFDNDSSVGFSDFFLFIDVFNTAAEGENAKFDLDSDGLIGFSDFFVFADNFGNRASSKRRIASIEIDPNTVLSLQASGGTQTDAQLIKVQLRADQVEDLKAFGVALHYDPRLVQFLHVDNAPGPLLESQGGTAPLLNVLTQTPGEVVVGNGITAGNPVSGKGLLAELTFRAVGSLNQIHFDLAEAYVARSGSEIRQVQQVRSTRLLPQTFYLGANFPNPFNPTTSLQYALPDEMPVELSIYDILGRKIRVLVREKSQVAGYYTLSWDGRDQQGRPTSSGVYFYRLVTPTFSRSHKMTLIK
jgi:hypothetical protein